MTLTQSLRIFPSDFINPGARSSLSLSALSSTDEEPQAREHKCPLQVPWLLSDGARSVSCGPLMLGHPREEDPVQQVIESNLQDKEQAS